MSILFVCLGNICRSVMAEMILKSILNENNINNVLVSSCATSGEEVGNPIYPSAKMKLMEKGIEISEHRARKMTISDYQKYDLIIGMDYNNKNSILRIIGEDNKGKVHLLGEYLETFKEIDDPWYTRDFESAYQDIYEACMNLYEEVIK